MFSLYSAGYIVAAAAALFFVPRYGWQWTFIFAIVPAVLVFIVRRMVHESVRFKCASAEAERRMRERGGRRSPVSIWSIPGARRRTPACR